MATETRPLRILMVLESAFPALTGGGAEMQVRTLSRALRARGQRVTVMALQLGWGSQEKVSRLDGVPLVRLTYPRIPLLSGPLMWLTAIAFLYRRRHRYGVWHVHVAHRLAAICAVMGRWLDKRVLTKVSGWWELEKGTLAPNARFINRLAYLGLRHTERWQVISSRIGATLVARGIPESRILAIPNAVDTDRFAHIRRAPDAAPRFVYIGRLEAEKGLDKLLEAFSRILPAHPSATLLLVGTGRLEDALKEEAAQLGIAASVTFAGFSNDIETQLADGNIGVLCSRIEGLSNALLEAMASGLPMVGSRISGTEDFIRHGENGWLFEPDDAADLAACLAAAAVLPPGRRQEMGENARATVQRKAGLDQVMFRLMLAYRGQNEQVLAAEVPRSA
jgi:glycosyltransferase involved in cell wall biosynthesis